MNTYLVIGSTRCGRTTITLSDITKYKRCFDADVRKNIGSGYAASLEEMLK